MQIENCSSNNTFMFWNCPLYYEQKKFILHESLKWALKKKLQCKTRIVSDTLMHFKLLWFLGPLLLCRCNVLYFCNTLKLYTNSSTISIRQKLAPVFQYLFFNKTFEYAWGNFMGLPNFFWVVQKIHDFSWTSSLPMPVTKFNDKLDWESYWSKV